VSDEPASGRRRWLVLTSGEHDVRSDREGACVHPAGGIGSLRIIMNTHVAEVTSETRLHVGARRRSERLGSLRAAASSLRRERARVSKGLSRLPQELMNGGHLLLPSPSWRSLRRRRHSAAAFGRRFFRR
jgi:hypothetical protein